MNRICPSSKSRTRRRRRPMPDRRGVITVLASLVIIILLAMLAFSIDVGYMVSARTDIQRAVDSGAFAGAALLGEGLDAARLEAIDFTRRNQVAGDPVPTDEIQVEFGQWDADRLAFLPPGEIATAVRVLARQPGRPMFFGKIFGQESFTTHAEAIATYSPRDIVVVLDYSASMNDDSELKYISKLGRSAIETNLWQIYQELGSPRFGSLQWSPVTVGSSDVNAVKARFGLDRIPYPYPKGSWDEYIQYVQTSDTIRRAGYDSRYGYLTLVNYWLERRPRHDETPDLWRTSEQPITAVKDALTVFLAYLQEVETDDRVGLAVYTSADGTGKLESPLTGDMGYIEVVSRQRQAGHYHRFTNIGAGMQKAREELEAHGRPGALKMIVLMTDGIANRPDSPDPAKTFVRQEAALAAGARFPVITVSLGSAADTDLMQEVADMTNGVHFNVPGGRSVSEYEEDLKEVFRNIADHRPLRLVR